VIADANGIPLIVATGPANQREEQLVLSLLETRPRIVDNWGKIYDRPQVLQGDRGYGFPWTISLLEQMGIRSLLAPRGSEHGSGLGKTRFVIERTMAWFAAFRRIRMCYERHGQHFQAFHELAACVICARRLKLARRRF
jgi:hypothetical protein